MAPFLWIRGWVESQRGGQGGAFLDENLDAISFAQGRFYTTMADADLV